LNPLINRFSPDDEVPEPAWIENRPKVAGGCRQRGGVFKAAILSQP
jgi:hypothetical protein